jgi:hypothetical protein
MACEKGSLGKFHAEVLFLQEGFAEFLFPHTIQRRDSWSWDGKAMKQLSEERTGPSPSPLHPISFDPSTKRMDDCSKVGIGSA